MSARNLKSAMVFFLVVSCLAGAQMALAGRADYATFDAFYGQGLEWGKYLIMGVLALVAGVAVTSVAAPQGLWWGLQERG